MSSTMDSTLPVYMHEVQVYVVRQLQQLSLTKVVNHLYLHIHVTYQRAFHSLAGKKAPLLGEGLVVCKQALEAGAVES